MNKETNKANIEGTFKHKEDSNVRDQVESMARKYKREVSPTSSTEKNDAISKKKGSHHK